EVVKAAAIKRQCGYGILKSLVECKGSRLPISDQVLKAASGNEFHGFRIMDLLLDQKGKGFVISDKILKSAAHNTTREGLAIMELMLGQENSTIPIPRPLDETVYQRDYIKDLLRHHFGPGFMGAAEDSMMADGEKWPCVVYAGNRLQSSS
ncbi:hypothetical protein ASPWEDRAFT_700720, partial [Aspergillus wentii DTO 134E9]